MENELTLRQCLVLLKAAYPQVAFGEESLAVYLLALADLDPRLLWAAVLRHLALQKGFPAIAELRQGVAALILEAEGTLSAPEAWAELLREVRRVGHWGRPDLPPLTKQALRALGGWRAICLSKNGTADRARFLEVYSLLLQRELRKLQQLPAVREVQAELAARPQRLNAEGRQLPAPLNGRGR